MLSDEKLVFSGVLRPPTMEFAGHTFIRRLTLVIDDGVIAKVFYPVFPPHNNAAEVHARLVRHRCP